MTVFFAAVLLATISGGIGAYLAQAKNRNPSDWFLWCFFFTFIALIVLALKDEQDENASKAERWHL